MIFVKLPRSLPSDQTFVTYNYYVCVFIDYINKSFFFKSILSMGELNSLDPSNKMNICYQYLFIYTQSFFH
ncbi:hypothetical protein BD770DRAFT_376995 [Pilaira anomala]|nr:hypothetical protein BD770DRAFT_376995 [Pilaira anomala]